jgi:hypothetical protein
VRPGQLVDEDRSVFGCDGIELVLVDAPRPAPGSDVGCTVADEGTRNDPSNRTYRGRRRVHHSSTEGFLAKESSHR